MSFITIAFSNFLPLHFGWSVSEQLGGGLAASWSQPTIHNVLKTFIQVLFKQQHFQLFLLNIEIERDTKVFFSEPLTEEMSLCVNLNLSL